MSERDIKVQMKKVCSVQEWSSYSETPVAKVVLVQWIYIIITVLPVSLIAKLYIISYVKKRNSLVNS